MPELGKTQQFLAADNVNLALCDLRDLFDCPVLIAQTKFMCDID